MKKTTKKPAEPKPIIIGGFTAGAIGYQSVGDLIDALPMTTLKELLRARSLPISKDKDTMTTRLADWAIRDGGTFTLELR